MICDVLGTVYCQTHVHWTLHSTTFIATRRCEAVCFPPCTCAPVWFGGRLVLVYLCTCALYLCTCAPVWCGGRLGISSLFTHCLSSKGRERGSWRQNKPGISHFVTLLLLLLSWGKKLLCCRSYLFIFPNIKITHKWWLYSTFLIDIIYLLFWLSNNE